MIERMDHERSKQETISELENKINEINKLMKGETDKLMTHYYKAYVRAYADCIDIINKRW